jgi:hypothetical protein
VCNSGGGFTFSDVYNLPVHIRKYYTRKLSDRIQKQNEEATSSQTSSQSSTQLPRGPKI